MTRTTPWRRTAIVLLAGLSLTAALAGCSSARSASSSGGGAAPVRPPNDNVGAAPGVPAQADGAQAGGGAPAGKPNLPVATGQRSIVYNGSITVRVKDVTAQAAELTSLAIGAGGLVSGDDREIDSGHSTATVTVRVPADQFTDVLNRIGKLGQEQSRKVSAEDVTAQVIDLDARIASQQASVDRVRALLARAQSIADITSIEAELAKREADLESMQAQQRNLADLTALSTIAATLLGPDAETPPPPKPAETGFWAGLKAGWRAFVASVSVLLTIIGALLPFALAVGIPLWLVMFWLRRRRRGQVLIGAPVPAGVAGASSGPGAGPPVRPGPGAPPSSPTAPPNPGSRM